ncbi:DUF5018 domain-containing protein [Aquimarina sp. 2201CG14-23]|uniref:DUF5018 domain-containing protein n=1 Tax=Aquimarina mycalae TaxID=3040073 RepID=UPI002477E210|nr:DUF5018 domain-containing protein [Aquimarina sp. 2201CG14-23]MDH7445236.1 DUF5018 domain-containing protein [Aquimarina sp. 2201CG14-23]
MSSSLNTQVFMEKQSLQYWIFFIATIVCFLGCSNDDETQNSTQNFGKILSFEFLAEDNSSLQIDITAEINEETKTITATLPEGTSLLGLKPKITITSGADIFPDSGFSRNFVNEVSYELSANMDVVAKYSVIISLEKSSDKNIKAFGFLASDNIALDTDITGEINETTKTISLVFDAGTEITALIPKIEIASTASIYPNPNDVQDFSNEIAYEVIAENGNKSMYTVHSNVLQRDEKEILKFEFLLEDNPGNLLENYEAIIDEEKNEIKLNLPEGTNLNNLVPRITISDGATVNPEVETSQNFNTILDYTVTAEDGTTAKYNINVYTDNSLRSDREALIDFYHAKSPHNNALSQWEIESQDVSNWQGVTVEEGRVTGLGPADFRLRMKVLPASIGKLTKLKTLSIDGLNLEEIPPEIGNLKELRVLFLSNNLLQEIPLEIGGMYQLRWLDLQDNLLEKIPIEIGGLRDLLTLNIKENPITDIPNEICALRDGFTTIELDDDDICEE